jgi:hypothetical protein
LREVRALPQNQPTGIVLLVAGAVVAVIGVLAAFCLLSAVVFGAFAKVMFLVLGLAGAMIVAVEDPFHDDLGDEATSIERLKLQGKVLVVTTLVAVLCTGLSFYTDHMQAYHDQAELADRIENASGAAVSRLDSVRSVSERIGEQLAVLNGQLKKLGDTVDQSLATPLKQIVEVTARIPTRTELLSKDELERKLGVLATADHLNQLTTSVGGLATAESVGRLSTSMSRLATAESVNRLATAESVNQLTVAVGTLATAARSAILRTSSQASRRRPGQRSREPAASEGVSRLLAREAPWLR